MDRVIFFILTIVISQANAARILAVYPTPSISHQVVFRPLTLELLKRGHEVVVFTTDPMFPKGEAPKNLTEIDTHSSYEYWREKFISTGSGSGDKDNMVEQVTLIFDLMLHVFENQMKTKEVQSILNDKTQKFDLLMLEAYFNPTLAIAHVFDAPVIQVSSFTAILNNLHIVGAPSHPLLHPTVNRQKMFNPTITETLSELYNHWCIEKMLERVDVQGSAIIKRLFGPNAPDLEELKKRVDMLFLNAHPIWDMNRPVPPNVVYMGGVHQKPPKELPKDLKQYLDASKNGVIYISFGTNVDPTVLPPNKIQTFVKVFSKLPYDILWKWNNDELPGRTENIRISKWLPQSDLLRHPKVKLFITQGGLQSTDEAITAGVPLIGVPMLGDQWYNVEMYRHHKIGVGIDMSTISEDILKNAIDEVVGNESYRQNIVNLRDVMRDEPQTSLDRAVWWAEYVIRHKGAAHLRSPSANVSWADYLQLKLVSYVALFVLSVVGALTFIVVSTFKRIRRISYGVKRKSS